MIFSDVCHVPSKFIHTCLFNFNYTLSIYIILIGTPKECNSDVFFAYHLVNSDDAISYYQEFFNCFKSVSKPKGDR